ncbi:MAG TPA: hypothetical protein VIT43_07915 [Candidatus Dormibacteraeota bacterium]
MKLWLLALAVAAGLFVAANAFLFRQASSPAPSVPQAIELTTINAQGAALTQMIHERSTIDRLSLDLGQLTTQREGAGCGQGTDGRYLAVFRYATGRSTTLTADKSGCQLILVSGPGWSAGRRWSGPALLRDFDALFPPSWQTGV